MQNSVNRLSNIAIGRLEVWQKYLSFGSSIAYYWATPLMPKGPQFIR